MIAFELTVPAAAEDAATLLLWEHGTAGVEVRGQGDERVLVAYFDRADRIEARLHAAAANVPGLARPSCRTPSRGHGHLLWALPPSASLFGYKPNKL